MGNSKNILMVLGVIIIMTAVGALLVFKPRGGTTSDNVVTPSFCVDVYNPSKAYNGTTLFADTYSKGVYEVDMNGNIVWEFTIPDAWKTGGGAAGLDAEVLSDNHVLISVGHKGIYEIDRSGNLVWSHLDSKCDHDADRLPNGDTIYVFGMNDTASDAQVKEVDSNGNIVWSWYARDNYLHRYPPSQYSKEGWVHTNAVQRLSNGDTMISMRNFFLTTIVDENGNVVKEYDWSSYGDNTDPHDPEIYESEGVMLVCLQLDSPYAAVEVSLENKDNVIWTYPSSGLRTTRDADLLPNGNVLITTVDTTVSGQRSVIIEVTPAGEIVWQLELKNAPVGKNPGWFYKAQRIGVSTPSNEGENIPSGESPLSKDLIFIPDPGIRVENASSPMAGLDEAGKVYLYYKPTSGPESDKVAVSTDGLNFSPGVTPTTYKYHPRWLYMPDNRWRTYLPDQSSDKVISMSAPADGTNPTTDPGYRYTAQLADKGWIGIVDVFPDDNGGYVMIYLGDKYGFNNARRAYSSPRDNGMNFIFDRDNVLGDAGLGGGNTYVDQFSIALPNGQRRLFAMTKGQYIDSFITSDGGRTFTHESGHRLTTSDFTELTVISLHDPSILRLPDGRYRMYVCANLGARYVIVSATTQN